MLQQPFAGGRTGGHRHCHVNAEHCLLLLGELHCQRTEVQRGNLWAPAVRLRLLPPEPADHLVQLRSDSGCVHPLGQLERRELALRQIKVLHRLAAQLVVVPLLAHVEHRERRRLQQRQRIRPSPGGGPTWRRHAPQQGKPPLGLNAEPRGFCHVSPGRLLHQPPRVIVQGHVAVAAGHRGTLQRAQQRTHAVRCETSVLIQSGALGIRRGSRAACWRAALRGG
mmetsp:Transcript_16137/g.41012  ORF Transcript_16137/g.41012 Transcript_16137/m.41012 type:complete len:224 (-) Transcript_16137:452-1123(-)